MGRQVNFYFGQQDEAEFVEHPRLEGTVLLIRGGDEPVNRSIDVHRLCNHTDVSMQVYICPASYQVAVRYLQASGGGHFFIDVHDSPVIEYCRSGLNPESNTLISGRIWYEHKYWDKDEEGKDILVTKPTELERLYNSLARWIKSRCERLPNGNYIGRHAMVLYKEGVKLSP